MKHEDLIVRWTDASWCDGYIDVLPLDTIRAATTKVPIDHTVFGPRGGRYGTARCLVIPRTRGVDLDYVAFAPFNRAHGMELGILRVSFAGAHGTLVKAAQWKSPRGRRFENGLATAAAEPARKTKKPVASTRSLYEGSVRQMLRETSQRNREARRRCCEHYGTGCSVCGTEFGKKYGPAAQGFIHVHHITPMSVRKRRHKIDPVADMRPVCPNCHAVIHLRRPEFTIGEVRRLLNARKRTHAV